MNECDESEQKTAAGTPGSHVGLFFVRRSSHADEPEVEFLRVDAVGLSSLHQSRAAVASPGRGASEPAAGRP